MSATIGVITFPGTLDDVDAARASRIAGAKVVDLWHADPDLKGVDAVVVPGGFSYGDYLRSGAISALAPVMRSVVEAGLLPGALTRNEGLHFHCVDTYLEVENNSTAWTSTLDKGQKILIPAKHGEGRFQASEETVRQLEDEGRVVFRYTDNFNGSVNAIAGVCSANGRVVGLMPHPEHACELLTGPSLDGLELFVSVVKELEK